MSVMSALVFSVLVGLAATWARAEVITQVLEEFQRVVLDGGDPGGHPHPALLHRRHLLRPGL